MLRAAFFSTGVFVALVGASLLFVDTVVINMHGEQIRQTGFRGLFMPSKSASQKVWHPPQWAAFSLVSFGAVTMLYSVALPRKKAANGG